MKTLRTYSSAETADLGANFAKQLIAGTAARKLSGGKGKTTALGRAAMVIALEGDLGAGKTTFTQGFVRGLGIKRRTASPTFIIMRRFAISGGKKKKVVVGSFKNFYHIDAYRIRHTDSLEPIGFEEVMADSQNIVLIEWPEKIKKILPKNAIHIKFGYGKKESERTIKIAARKIAFLDPLRAKLEV